MTGPATESVEDFRARARVWIQRNLERREPSSTSLTLAEARTLQAAIFDAGFAGLAIPVRYGGAGLTLDHQRAWAEEVSGFRIPDNLYPSIAILGMTVLDHGCEELKHRHLPRILRGEELWLQLLSEPSAGSDMAGAMTRATRRDDTWVITGSKIWTSFADEADYGICLARTDWDAPKHRGLSMLVVPLRDPRVTITPIVGNDGGPAHFFQEFFDNVVVPAENLLGLENDGWTVAHTLLSHERNAIAGVGHGLGLGGGGDGGRQGVSGVGDLIGYSVRSRRIADPASQDLITQAYIDEVVRAQLADRIATGMRLGVLRGDWGSLLKLGVATDTLRRAEIGLAVAGASGVIWVDDETTGVTNEPGLAGRSWLTARSISIGGGTNEMQRNIISERLLGMPREPTNDRDLPFREVVRRRLERQEGS